MQVPVEVEETAIESIKFALVGLIGVGVNFIVLTIAVYQFGLKDSIAIGLGIFFSVSSNYILNRIWTFESEKEVAGEYVKYVTLNLIGILIQYSVAVGLEKYFETIGFLWFDLIIFRLASIYIASTAGILLGFVSNFLFSKYMVFT